MKNEISQLKLQLIEKDEIIRKKDEQIDLLRVKNDELNKREIEELKEIIKKLKEEKEILLNTINDLNAMIKAQNKKLEDQAKKLEDQAKKLEDQKKNIEKLLDDKKQMEEASLISDIMYQLYKQFIVQHENDTVIKENFITYKTSVRTKKVYIADIDTKLFHRCLNEKCDDEELKSYIKEKFKLAVNNDPSEKNHLYEYNEKMYSEIVWNTRKTCHSHIRDISYYSKKEDFFSHAEEQIEKLTRPNYKEFGKELLEQFQNLYKVKIFVLICS